MVKVFIIFLIIILILATVIGLAVMIRGKKYSEDIDSQYYDKEGNHIYYDRSRIEKEKFLRKNPDATPRNIRHLLSRKR